MKSLEQRLAKLEQELREEPEVQQTASDELRQLVFEIKGNRHPISCQCHQCEPSQTQIRALPEYQEQRRKVRWLMRRLLRKPGGLRHDSS